MSFVDRASSERSPDGLSWPRAETRIKQSRKSTSGEEERNGMIKGWKEGKQKLGINKHFQRRNDDVHKSHHLCSQTASNTRFKNILDVTFSRRIIH